jgi:hypothetical protein
MIEFSENIYENGLRLEKTVYYPNRKIKSKKIYQYTYLLNKMTSGISSLIIHYPVSDLMILKG